MRPVTIRCSLPVMPFIDYRVYADALCEAGVEPLSPAELLRWLLSLLARDVAERVLH